MLVRLLVAAPLISLLLLCGSISASAQDVDLYYPVYAIWRGDDIKGSDLDTMRILSLDGCILPAVEIKYDDVSQSIVPTIENSSELESEDALGLDFYLVADFYMGKASEGAGGQIDVMSLMAGDICGGAMDGIEAASGNVVGLLVRVLDTEPDLRDVAEICYALRNHAALRGFEGLQIGVYAGPAWLDDQYFPRLAESVDVIVADFTAKNPLGEMPELYDKDWVVRGARGFEKAAKPFIVALPMYEMVIRDYGSEREVVPDNVTKFDKLVDAADKLTTDAAGNPVAEFSRDTSVGDLEIKAGTRFVHLKSNPGTVVDIVKTLKQKAIGDIVGVALDGLPYEPSEGGYRASVYVGSLKGASVASGVSATGSPLKQELETRANLKAQSKAFWMITLVLATAIALTGLSVMRKWKYKGDEADNSGGKGGGRE